MLKIAVAKGRIAEEVSAMLSETPDYGGIMDLKSRKLIFRDEDKGVQFFLVKPVDVPVYVASGAADIGIAGKDVLLEAGSPAYEVLDLGICGCRMILAGLPEKKEIRPAVRKIATKYPAIAEEYFNSKKEPVEIIKLSGSIELAPLVGLSDAIVDIVESGRTLKENGLIIYEDICDITARMVVNRVSFKLKNQKVNAFMSAVRAASEGGVSYAQDIVAG